MEDKIVLEPRRIYMNESLKFTLIIKCSLDENISLELRALCYKLGW